MDKISQRVASVVLPRPRLGELSYFIPEGLEISVGDCVEIELRKLRVWGIVKDISETVPDELEGVGLKPVLTKIWSTPVFSNRAETSFLEWLSEYYIYPFPKLLKQIFGVLVSSKNRLAGDFSSEKHLELLRRVENPEKVELNPAQRRVVESVRSRWESGDFKPVLLYGVTGSGKSEVFAELCREIVRRGKQILYIVPEIGLTSNVLEHLISRIGVDGVVLHSSISGKKRFSSLVCAINGDAKVIVATRSAVLYPFFNLGLIVIDEEHDSSLKNMEQPYYHARDAAVVKAGGLKIPVIMGSATPSSDSWYNANCGKYYLETLTERANMRELPPIEKFPYRGDLYIPSKLVELVKNIQAEGGQTLFFLNRRGFATLARCEVCSKILKCPNCDTALIYHKKKDRLQCHHCGYTLKEKRCPECGEVPVLEGIGIEKLYEAIGEYFPDSKILSFDRDTLGNVASLDAAVKSIAGNECQIIVGTMLISKGHNFKNLRCVVIKFADYLLGFSEQRAAERCFQLITQVAGRAGRFDAGGLVFAETLYPEHYIWKYIENYDYTGFMEEELGWRESLGLPPFTRSIIVKVSGANSEKVTRTADEYYQYVLDFVEKCAAKGVFVFPPSEPPLAKLQNRFRVNISITLPKNSKFGKALKRLLSELPARSRITVTFDVDSLSEN